MCVPCVGAVLQQVFMHLASRGWVETPQPWPKGQAAHEKARQRKAIETEIAWLNAETLRTDASSGCDGVA